MDHYCSNKMANLTKHTQARSKISRFALVYFDQAASNDLSRTLFITVLAWTRREMRLGLPIKSSSIWDEVVSGLTE